MPWVRLLIMFLLSVLLGGVIGWLLGYIEHRRYMSKAKRAILWQATSPRNLIEKEKVEDGG